MDIDPFENSRKFAVPAGTDSPPGHVEQSLSLSLDNSKGVRDNRGFHVR